MYRVEPPEISIDLSTPANPQALLKGSDPVVEVLIAGQDFTGLRVNAPSIGEAKLDKVVASSADLEKVNLIDVQVTHSDLTAASCAEASWCRVTLSDLRASGLKLHGSTLQDVCFKGCKLDLSNFRSSTLKRILFVDCVLDEADFYKAKMEQVRFENCSLHAAEFSGVSCKQVDLRTSELDGLNGVAGLAGATIDSVQLTTIARTLAAELKVNVSDN